MGGGVVREVGGDGGRDDSPTPKYLSECGIKSKKSTRMPRDNRDPLITARQRRELARKRERGWEPRTSPAGGPPCLPKKPTAWLCVCVCASQPTENSHQPRILDSQLPLT